MIAPKGLVTQWVAEMITHFGEDFRLLIPGDFSAYRLVIQEENIWCGLIGSALIRSVKKANILLQRGAGLPFASVCLRSGTIV